jgi:threonine dehydratase
MLVEPAGAAALGALLAGHLPETRGSNVAVILSGGNLSLSMFSKWFGGQASAAS